MKILIWIILLLLIGCSRYYEVTRVSMPVGKTFVDRQWMEMHVIKPDNWPKTKNQ